ncbi:trehalose-phosphatase [Pedococcus sp. 5OH_020]|uniref:trehalose-phosphatase n=1 Tax=Pedococcus sp. 5OH_020 TaxID=2989814 RepID=UPI0022E9B5BF|nr:trehalose-phosphatase [Pedococcus sp. 5OH_020]
MTVPDDLREAASRLAGSSSLLVATDFDGVLAPLVQDPGASRPLPGTIECLEGLAALPDTYAAVVSGRDLETLTRLTGLHQSAVSRIGSHGAESSDAGPGGLGEEERHRLKGLVEDLAAVSAAHPGSALEHKPAAVVLHTRGMSPEAAGAAERDAVAVTARHTGVHVLQGKHVVEASVVDADKGTALLRLSGMLGASAVAYLGDDVTDEDAFAALGSEDLTVKVGPGDTGARFRVESPQDAAEVLSLLLELRSSACG